MTTRALSEAQFGWMRTADLRPTERWLGEQKPALKAGKAPALRSYLDAMKGYVQEHGYPGPIEVHQYSGESGNRAIRKNTPHIMQGHHRHLIAQELKDEYAPVRLDPGSDVPKSFTTEQPEGARGVAPDPDVERTWKPEGWGRSLP